MKKSMTEQQRERLVKIYKVYSIIDWIIAIAIIGTPLLIIIIPFMPDILQGGGIDEVVALASLEAIINSVGDIPAMIIVPIFIAYTAYTIFCFILYVKVWSIKEIRYSFTYWFDWILTIGLTAYELFIFYLILFG